MTSLCFYALGNSIFSYGTVCFSNTHALPTARFCCVQLHGEQLEPGEHWQSCGCGLVLMGFLGSVVWSNIPKHACKRLQFLLHLTPCGFPFGIESMLLIWTCNPSPTEQCAFIFHSKVSLCVMMVVATPGNIVRKALSVSVSLGDNGLARRRQGT